MEKILNKFFEWKYLELINHIILLLLVTYIIYILFNNKQERTLTNLLLLGILIVLDLQVHQTSNIKNNI